MKDTGDFTPLHASVGCGNLEATKAFVEKCAALGNSKKYSVTPLMVLA